MKKRNLLMLMLVLLTGMTAMRTVAQQLPELPMDPAIRYGKLPNGLTYYIRHNKLPEKQAHFYIAQKVGSVQEDDNQRGLAHFLEHMCFNGTTNFPGNGLIRFCESIGVKFGENLNAYTSTDETVYNIDNVPVSDANIDSCLTILHDWADGLILDPAEIDKERGVIHEEWRMRSSAGQRIFERNLPTLYPGSKYGHRMPIGLMEIIDNFKPEFLRAYYEKWYRPDLQGIIVVGDIDVEKVEARIKAIFSPIQMPENAAPYETYPVPTNAEAIYVIDKDKEQQQSVIELMFKHDPIPEAYKNTPVNMSYQLFTGLASTCLSARLNELSQKPDCPFIASGAGDGKYLMSKTMNAFTIYILPKPGQDAAAVQKVMEEVERASRFGFTETELIRAREEFMSGIEKIYDNREKQRHDFYVTQYVRHFLEKDPIPDLETEFNIYKGITQQITSAQLSQAVSGLFKELTASTDSNFVFLAMYPEKEGVAIPAAESMKQAVAAAKAAQLEAYVDNVKNEPLIPVLPKKGKIAKEEKAPFGYTCWTLSNGARVFFRKTDFNDSEVQFRATSFGGQSLTNDKDLELFKGIVTGGGMLNVFDVVMDDATGLGNFTSVELEKKLAGKQASCSPALGEATETLSGTSTPKDLRTLFELIYLRFQQPANDTEGFNNCMNLLRTQLENLEKIPDMAFTDSVRSTAFGHNPRRALLKSKDLDKITYEDIRRVYAERFSAAGDFDFYFTGAFDTDSLRAFTEQYIAPLKAVKKRETYVDRKIRPVKGTVDNRFVRAMETPQGNIVQLWNGDLKYSMKDAAVVNALGQILTQRYLKSIREEGSMAYSVGAVGNAEYGVNDNYAIQIYCPVKPAKADSALLLMEQGILEIAKGGVTKEELDKVKEFELKEYADNQRKNSYWQSLIVAVNTWKQDEQTGYEETIRNLTSEDIRKFVNDVLLKQHNRVTVTMLPVDFTE